jgi:hypothetical protein
MDSAAEEIENRKLLGAFLDELQNGNCCTLV